jgi:hypothetical protein
VRLTALVLVVAGCPTPTSFDRQFVVGWCAALERCAPADFAVFSESDWPASSQLDCRRNFHGAQEGVSACLAGACAYDVEAAGECLRSLRTSSCAALDDGSALAPCSAVWKDCGPGADACRGLEP